MLEFRLDGATGRYAPSDTSGTMVSHERTTRFSGALNLDDDQSGHLHDEILRIEDRIEQLTEKIESCRKLILASRIAVAGGAVALAGMLFGAIRFDPAVMAAAVAALLGGIAVWGSNRSTEQEATKELISSETNRSMLIQKMDLRDVTPLSTRF